MNILILGIGNILFQDEGIGAHFIHYLDEKYEFHSSSNTISIVDGGTLAQRLIPIIVKYDKVFVIDCIDALNSKPGDVYFFDYLNAPSEIDWQGSAHEVEMLQTLQMIEMMGDLPPVKIVGVIPYVIGESSTFTMTDEVLQASVVMEKTIIDYIKSFDITVSTKKELQITDISSTTYLEGFYE